ncbi:hypothetical protein CYY_000119 [Polysphondylium violaceum]|uniref:Ankyrin repeat-containing protein n=1 Tax=Polysphondylium violaceum TaxID=133409 RepID=A0A8J4Q4D8_9MYCE|nr:hypothetical protein CYY_000119 [Polysphondylium violaceum]
MENSNNKNNNNNLFLNIFRNKTLFKHVLYYIYRNLEFKSKSFVQLSLLECFRINRALFDQKIDLYFSVYKHDPSKAYYVDLSVVDAQFLLEEPTIDMGVFTRVFEEHRGTFEYYSIPISNKYDRLEETDKKTRVANMSAFSNADRDHYVKQSLSLALVAVTSGRLDRVLYLKQEGYGVDGCNVDSFFKAIKIGIRRGTMTKELLEYLMAQRERPDRVDKEALVRHLSLIIQSAQITDELALVLFNSFLKQTFYESSLFIFYIVEQGLVGLAKEFIANMDPASKRVPIDVKFNPVNAKSVETYKVFSTNNIRLSVGVPFRKVFSSFDVFEYYVTNHRVQEDTMLSMDSADLAKIFDERCIALLEKHNSRVLLDAINIDVAAIAGNFTMVRWCHKLGKRPTNKATNSTYEIVKFLLEVSDAGFTDIHLTNCFHGDVRVVKLLHETSLRRDDIPILFTYRSIDRCAAHGYLDIIQYLLDNRTEGFSREAINAAVANGHLEIFKLLYKTNSSFTLFESSVQSMVEKGHSRMFDYLMAYTHYKPTIVEFCSQLQAKTGHSKLLYFINPDQQAPNPTSLTYPESTDIHHDISINIKISEYTHAIAKGSIGLDRLNISDTLVTKLINKQSGSPKPQCFFFLYTFIYLSPYPVEIRKHTLLTTLTTSIKMKSFDIIDYFASTLSSSIHSLKMERKDFISFKSNLNTVLLSNLEETLLSPIRLSPGAKNYLDSLHFFENFD